MERNLTSVLSDRLHRACMNGQTNNVKVMLKAEKPDLTVMDSSGMYASYAVICFIICFAISKSPLSLSTDREIFFFRLSGNFRAAAKMCFCKIT